MSGSIDDNVPAIGNSVSGPVTIGCGSPPTSRYGLSNKPAGSDTSERLPYGGAAARLEKNSPVGKSYINAYDDLTAMRPSPCTSHATPMRGEKFHHFLFRPDVPEGNPASPG